MLSIRIAAGLTLAAVTLVPRPVAAQTTTGGIVGVVKDADGAVVPGATAQAPSTTPPTPSSTPVSDDTGRTCCAACRSAPTRSPSNWPASRPSSTPNVVVRVNEEVRLDVALTVGALTETVTVSGDGARRSTRSPARSRPSSISSASRTCR